MARWLEVPQDFKCRFSGKQTATFNLNTWASGAADDIGLKLFIVAPGILSIPWDMIYAMMYAISPERFKDEDNSKGDKDTSTQSN